MPSPVLPDGTIRAILVTRTIRRPCHNILYYETTVPPTRQRHIDAIAKGLDDAWRPVIRACITSETMYVTTQAYYHGASDAFFEAASTTGEEAGLVSGGSDGDTTLPDEVCMVWRKLTGLGGREDRGRMFLSGISETFNDEGLLNGTGQVAAQGVRSGLPEDIGVSYTFDAENGETEADSFEATLHARHWNRKDNVLRPIIGAQINTVLLSRRDRRAPLRAVGL